MAVEPLNFLFFIFLCSGVCLVEFPGKCLENFGFLNFVRVFER